MAYTTINKGEDHFNAVITTGTGSSQAVTGVGFQPDWIWGKRRDGSGHPTMFDVIRGITKGLETSGNGAEFTSTDYYSSFDSDGFTIAAGSAGTGNGSSQTAVHWCWKAGGAAVSNGNGSITSSVSANAAAGFSIVTYTGTGSNATVGHGLSSAPKWIITKARTPSGRSWGVFHSNISNANNLYLDGTDVESSGGTFWNSTSPTSTVFSVGTAGDSNGSGFTMVAYCFAEV